MFKSKRVTISLMLIASLFFTGLIAAQAREKISGGADAQSDIVPIALAKADTAIKLSPEQRRKTLENYGKLPLSFIENQGQIDQDIAYYIQSPGRSLYFTKNGHALRFTHGKGNDAKAHTIKVELLNAATKRIAGLERAPGTVSYFKGTREQWKTAIPNHAKIGYVQPWPGIDLAYDGHGGRLESIYTVAPHADPTQIKLRYSGQDSLKLDDAGNLVYTTSVGEVKETPPILYQEIDGARVSVEGRYVLLDETTVAFQIAQYNPDHALVIDPTLVYAGYIGGSGSGYEAGIDIAVDNAGNAYVVGYTDSTETSFPVQGGPDLTFNGLGDAFVAKINSAGTAFIYVSYIGGSGAEYGTGIAVDSAGNAYITGYTDSTETSFPVVNGPDLTFNNIYGFGFDAFVAKVNSTGTTLVYAGYIGGDQDDKSSHIAVDSAGNAYVTGVTESSETSFPVVGGPDLTYNGYSDAFVAKVNPTGTALVYAGYIGGSDYDQGNGIAVDSAGNAYITGYTGSTETSFPVVGGPDLTYNGNNDAFVAKVNPAGTALVYAGYIGGSDGDRGTSIAVDSAGNAYIAGDTGSTEASFPVLSGPDLTHNGDSDAFVAKVNPTGTTLVYAGYIGGSGSEQGQGIAVDSAGNAYVSGITSSTEATFPVIGGPDLTNNGGYTDAFVAKVNPTGTALIYAGYIGGNGADFGIGIAVDSAGNAYVTGVTNSTEATFPVVGGPDLTFNGVTGTDDAFIAKISGQPLYNFMGFLDPILNDGSRVFKLGSTVPIKFQLTDATGAFITTATATLTIQKFSGASPVGTPIEAIATGGSDSGNLFRYSGQYIFNLSTKPLSTGTWQIQVHMNDGSLHTVMFGLK